MFRVLKGLFRWFLKSCQLIWTALLSLLIVGISFAQEDFRLTQLSVNEGLSHSDVTSIVQDRTGYLWLGTNNGLNRYDGNKVKVFKGQQGVQGSLQDSRIAKLFVDRRNRIWIGTHSSGLCYYENKTQQFHTIDLRPALHKSSKAMQSSFKFAAISEDRNGDIWVAVRKRGIFNLRIDADGKILKLKNYPLRNPLLGATLEIETMLVLSPTHIILGTSKGLCTLNPITGKAVKLTPNNNETVVRSIFKDRSGVIWVGRPDGLFLLDQRNQTLSRVRLSFDVKNIKAIAQDNTGDIWLGCFGYGSYRLGRPDAHGRYAVYPLNKDILPTDFIGGIDRINCFLQDKYGLLWIGTSAGGAGYINVGQRSIKRIQNISLANRILPDNYITAVFADGKRMWIGTRKGLTVYEDASNVQLLISGAHVSSIYKDSDQVYWITTREDGLKKVRYQAIGTAQVSDVAIPGLPDDLISITQDHLKQLWVGSITNGVFIIKPGSNKALTFQQYTGGFSSSSKWINQLYKDPMYPWIWISTRDAGLDKVVLSGAQVTQLKNYRYGQEEDNLSSDHVWPVKRSNDSTVWIGTLGGGINKLIRSKNGRERISYITTANGLKDNDIEAMEIDKKGSIWLAGFGLSKYDPKKNKVSFYDHNDGLQSNAFKVGASFVDNTGRLYFGGINGLNYFYPKDLGDSRIPPDILFTDVKIFNASVPITRQSNRSGLLHQALNFTDTLVFSASQNDFTLEFAGIQLAQHAKLTYHYKLDGYNKSWIETNVSSASFANLYPGSYEFLVYSSYNGIRSPIRKLQIKILPPWWFSWWAFSIYIILIVIGFNLYKKVITKENSLKHELVIAEKEQELSAAKLDFFTNISHELRTPLSLIYGPITELLQEATEHSRDKLWLLFQNTQRLMSLTNQLLDFRRMESGKLRLNAAEGNIISFVREIWLIFKDKAKEKSISYHISTELEKVKLYFDREKMELVFSNLLSNAFKYTDQNGSININIYIHGNTTTDAVYEHQALVDNYLEIVVEDNGVGIPPQEVEKIFDIYYQVAGSNSVKTTGTGLGLSIAKGIMDLHKGFIKVESRLQQGTRFIVGIPFGRAHLEPSNFIADYKGADHLIHYSDLPLSGPVISAEQKIIAPASIIENENAELSTWKILLVEDNAELLEYLKDNFKRSFSVVTAKNGADGWEKVKTHWPDLVISDVMMPEMSGLELCRMIKLSPEFCFIPVLLLTARTASIYEIEGIETGADDYITKPFDIRLLNAKVNSFLQGRLKIKAYYKNIISLKDVVPKGNNADQVFVNKMIEVVEHNLENKDFGVLMLAQELAMSKSSLFKRVKDITGNSPVDFIRSVRIRKAAKLLLEGDLNVNEIASQVGISDLKYFREQFKKHYGTTPTNYAKQSHPGELTS